MITKQNHLLGKATLMKEKSTLKISVILLTFISTLIIGCNKESDTVDYKSNGDAKIEISIASVASKDAYLKKYADINNKKNPSDIKLSDLRQDQFIDLGNGYKIKATLIDETLMEQYSSKLIANSTPRNKSLDPGVKYRVIAYNPDGTYEDHKDFAYGQESSSSDFILTGGIQGASKTYTFVVYSLNSTINLPEIPNIKSTNINDVELNVSPNDGQLLFFKTDLPVKRGNNKLDINLDHIFAQITTTINVIDQPLGYLSRINNPRFIPQANTVKVNFNKSGINPTYNYIPQTDNSVGSSISFPTISGTTTKTITSTPTYIASETTTTGSLKIDELVIYAVLAAAPVPQPLPINKAISIPNVKITPGHRYNLILNYDIPCVEVIEYVNGKFAWYQGSGNVAPINIEMDPTDFGFSFDIYRLDNSFNMLVNDVNVIKAGSINSTELQFEANISGAPLNLKFEEDNTNWSSTGNSQIYHIYSYYGNGTTAGDGNSNTAKDWSINKTIHTPILKIVVDVEGNISLWGRKTNSNITFYKIVPTEGAFTFNKVEWKKVGKNKVTISQHAQGVSAMFGYGRGYKLILCPTN